MVSDGFKGMSRSEDFILQPHRCIVGFSQKRYSNGTFAFNNPVDCSPNDKNDTRACSLQGSNMNGFYESSSWEYSW